MKTIIIKMNLSMIRYKLMKKIHEEKKFFVSAAKFLFTVFIHIIQCNIIHINKSVYIYLFLYIHLFLLNLTISIIYTYH